LRQIIFPSLLTNADAEKYVGNSMGSKYGNESAKGKRKRETSI
jgi:hypothetical protein